MSSSKSRFLRLRSTSPNRLARDKPTSYHRVTVMAAVSRKPVPLRCDCGLVQARHVGRLHLVERRCVAGWRPSMGLRQAVAWTAESRAECMESMKCDAMRCDRLLRLKTH
jgi:hypothetical protein